MIEKIIYRAPCSISATGEPGQGCQAAEPVVDPLIITPDVAIQRGEWILDSQGYHWAEFSVSGPNVQNYLPGKIAQITGTSFGSLLCKIIGVQFVDDFQTANSTVTLTIKQII